MEFAEEIREFLIESNENLASLDREIVELEKNPGDEGLIASVFRTIHTIKGTCGFFGFDLLGSLTHLTENLLSQVREKQRPLTPELITLVLEAVDQVKVLLLRIESTGKEGEDASGALRERLEAAHRDGSGAARAEFLNLSKATNSSVQPSQEKPEADAVAAGEVLLDRRATDHVADSTIRVDVSLLDRLMNLVGELVLTRNQLLQHTAAGDVTLQGAMQRLGIITGELQESAMKARMQPIGVVWSKLPRVVRDLAARCGKEIRLEMEGAGTELDKTIIEAIKDPLTHLVRNACDHGIELPEVRIAGKKEAWGTLRLSATQEGGFVRVDISDDGAGMEPAKLKAKAVARGLILAEQAASMSDEEAVRLIFLPGFSTAAQVTSVSGRGVGMDVVKTNIEQTGGSVDVLNRPGQGSTVRIKIPLTLAIVPGLVVMLDGEREERFAIPQAALMELVRLEGAGLKRIEDVDGTKILRHRGKLLPLVSLRKVLGRPDMIPDTVPDMVPDMVPAGEGIHVVVVQAGSRVLGLAVDRIGDTQEIVVKSLGRQLRGLGCYAGATIMGDGRPALILDVAGVARLAGIVAETAAAVPPLAAAREAIPAEQPRMLLLFCAGGFERLAVPLSLVARLEEVRAERIEQAGGRRALNYRGEILRLVTLESLAGEPRLDSLPPTGTVHVIVLTDGVRRLGLIVDQILDIVKEAVAVKRSRGVPGLLGSALVGGKITDFLDLDTLVQAAGESWLAAPVPGERARLLLVDPSAAARDKRSFERDRSGGETGSEREDRLVPVTALLGESSNFGERSRVEASAG